MAGGNKTSSRSGLGQRESIGNPLNLTLGRPVSPRVEASGPASCPSPNNQKKTNHGSRRPSTAWFEEKIVEYSRSRPYAITRFRKCIMTYSEDASLGIKNLKLRTAATWAARTSSGRSASTSREAHAGDFVVGQDINIAARSSRSPTRTRRPRNYRNI